MTEVVPDHAIHALLRGYTPLVEVVGDSIWPGGLPLHVSLPAVTYFEVFTGRFHRDHGGPAGLAIVHYQVDCWAGADSLPNHGAYDAATAVRALVNDALDGFRGTVGGVTVAGVTRLFGRTMPEPEPALRRASYEYVVSYHTSATALL